MRRLVALPIAVAVLAAVTAASAGPTTTITIRHQLRGCHTWSVNGGPWAASQAVRLARNGTITIVDNDVMPHKLIQQSGPAVRFVGKPALTHMGASVEVVFRKAGVYRFTTKPGEDYIKGVKTVGEDNVLRLKVTVP